MAGEIAINTVGTLVRDPELRFQPSGKAVANLTLAVNRRVKADNGSWENDDNGTTWLRCAVWEAMAENVAESLVKGDRVIIQGAFYSRKYEVEGQERTSLEVRIDAIGPDLRFATAKASKVENGGSFQPKRQPQADPWATPASSEPPF